MYHAPRFVVHAVTVTGSYCCRTENLPLGKALALFADRLRFRRACGEAVAEWRLHHADGSDLARVAPPDCPDCRARLEEDLRARADFFSCGLGRALVYAWGFADYLIDLPPAPSFLGDLCALGRALRLRIARRIAPLAVAGVSGDLASFPAPGIECYRTDSGKWDYRRIPEEVR